MDTIINFLIGILRYILPVLAIISVKIKNKSGTYAVLQTLGAGIQSLFVPDKNGRLGDVVLGFDNPSAYTDPDNGYQGLAVGRWANRIRGAKFSFGGKEYHTPKNQGEWTLHGGGRFSFTNWEIKEYGDNFVIFSRFSPDGEDGFPGDFSIEIKYTLGDDNALGIAYTVLSDRDTVANPTNHSYFNLAADGKGTIEDHLLFINADKFTETDENQLPTGELGSVDGTMMDFRNMHLIGDKIDEPFRAVIDGIGYDNNYCLNDYDGTLRQAAVLAHEKSGRKMEVWTDLPGIQLYCGGWLSKTAAHGKASNGAVKYRRGVALETQFYPDTVNIPAFPFRCVKGGFAFTTTTIFKFGIM